MTEAESKKMKLLLPEFSRTGICSSSRRSLRLDRRYNEKGPGSAGLIHEAFLSRDIYSCWWSIFRIIPLKIEFSSQRREMLLFLTTKIAAVTSRAKLAPVVQKMDIGIQWINIRESNCAILRIKIYPVDSTIHLLNNWGQQ